MRSALHEKFLNLSSSERRIALNAAAHFNIRNSVTVVKSYLGDAEENEIIEYIRYLRQST